MVGDLVIKDMERLRYSVFTGNVYPQASQVLEPSRGVLRDGRISDTAGS